MSKTLYMMKGLPGSGKTTKAKKIITFMPPGSIIRVNRDELRQMLSPGGKFNKTIETAAKGIRDQIIEVGLLKGCHVIVDDTNFGWEEHLRLLAKQGGAAFYVVDLTSVSLETCIARDLKREHSVGKNVILGMYNKYLKPKPASAPAWDASLPNAIIVDIDGTVAEMNGRGPFEWNRVYEDKPRDFVIANLQDRKYATENLRILFVSGRDEVCYADTSRWIKSHMWDDGWYLFMRPQGDMRRDSIVKREIYEKYILGKYNVVGIYDDRPQVIRECWQALGFGDRIFNVGSGEEF